jgi:GTP-binding protein HflX
MWTHLARQAGGRVGGATGGVGVRGPGETQLEVDRREINRKITFLKDALENVRAQRAEHRNKRQLANIPVIAIVGYTNAGKSTLLNRLIAEAGADANDTPIYAADQLFATLDPTTRRIRLPHGKEVLFSDTVGFIQKLPTQLIAAFRATLEEVTEANLMLHVVDITHPNALEQAEAVEDTLAELEATTAPIITVLNKIDAFTGDAEAMQAVLAEHPDSVAVSAKTAVGIEALLARIERVLEEFMIPIEVDIPYANGNLVSLLYEQGIVETESHDESGTHMVARLTRLLAATFKRFETHTPV